VIEPLLLLLLVAPGGGPQFVATLSLPVASAEDTHQGRVPLVPQSSGIFMEWYLSHNSEAAASGAAQIPFFKVVTWSKADVHMVSGG
jgi:hypothetical protein